MIDTLSRMDRMPLDPPMSVRAPLPSWRHVLETSTRTESSAWLSVAVPRLAIAGLLRDCVSASRWISRPDVVAEGGGIRCIQAIKAQPGLRHVIPVGRLREVCDDRQKHLSRYVTAPRTLRDLTRSKCTSGSHCGRIYRQTNGRFQRNRFNTLRRYRICGVGRRICGTTQSLRIQSHRIKVFASMAMGIGAPDIHEAVVVGERRSYG
jgi:hypothetical protein